MKKGILSRLLVIVLVCAMLFGLMGFTTIKPQDGEDGVQNEEVTEQTNDNEPVGEPEGEEPSEEPGEEPSEEPGDEPGDEPSEEPELIKVNIASGMGGTLALVALPEGAETAEDGSAVFAAEGTELSFVAAVAKKGVKHSEFVSASVDGAAVKAEDLEETDAGYVFTVTVEKPVTVSAEFAGVKSIDLSPINELENGWAEGREIKVATFGNVGDIYYYTDNPQKTTKIENGTVQFKDEADAKGTDYTVCVKVGEETVSETLNVNMIDINKPVVTSGERTRWHLFRDDDHIWTVNVSDSMSGIVPGSLVVYYLNNGVRVPVAANGRWSDNNSRYEFTTTNDNQMYFEIADAAGHLNVFDSKDTKAPVITAVYSVNNGDVLYNVNSNDILWAAKDGKLVVKCTDDSAIDISVSHNEETEALAPTAMKKDGTAVVAEFAIPEAGEYVVTAVDENGNTATSGFTVAIDENSPVLDPDYVEINLTNDNILAKIINWASWGRFCNSELCLSFDVTDDESGIMKREYTLVNAEDPEAESWTELGADNTVYLPKDFEGSIKVRFTDYVGNEEIWDVTYDNGQTRITEVITNKGTYNSNTVEGEGVVVFALANDKAYDGTEWVKKVDFQIAPTLKDGHSVEQVDAYYIKDGVKVSLSYNGENGVYSISDVFAGNVVFDVKVLTAPAVETTETTEAKAAEYEPYSVSVPVLVQNTLGVPQINVAGTPTKIGENSTVPEAGWFNGNGNTLKGVSMAEPDGNIAPCYVEWTLQYRHTGTDESSNTVKAAGSFGDEFGDFKLNPECIAPENLKCDDGISEEGIYILTATAYDAAGNSKTASKEIKYATEAPIVHVRFVDEPNSQHDGEKFSKYYNVYRTATITVEDDSFTSKLTPHSITPVITRAPGYGEDAIVKQNWTFADGKWTMQYIYGLKDSTRVNGDDYQLAITAVDIAGNVTTTDTEGNVTSNGTPNGKAYAGFASDDFTVDQTKPAVTVSFNNNNVRNDKYFNAPRQATITVTEHNFYDEWAKITANGSSRETAWSHDGDVHTKTVYFNNDNPCTLNISVTDKAGNTCVDQDVDYSGCAAPRDFVIDQTNPTLGVTGTDQTPYPDACTPGFTGNDTNISDGQHNAEYTVQLTRTVREHKNQDVTSLFANVNPNMGKDLISAVYANIPDDAENDGIYTLNVSVTDLAGNSSQTSNTFTVNRHGSFYVFNDALSDLVNAKYVQKADGKYSITEYNASPLVAGSVKIEIYRDGQLEKTIKPTVGAAVLGASGLYEYTYDLPTENFAQDGRYSVSVSSEDEAKNTSDNTKLEESILEFTVDSVNPEIVIIKGLEKAIVNAEELEFTVNAIDTYGIKSIQIVVDGEVVKTFVPQEVYDQLKAEGKAMQQYEVMDENLDFTAAYTLYESNSSQSIEIVVTDMAGNSFTTASKDFDPVYDFHDSILVSTSFFARYIHNPLALVGTGIVIAGAVWLVIAKKKKTEEAAA